MEKNTKTKTEEKQKKRFNPLPLIIVGVVACIGLYTFGVRPVYSYTPEEYVESDATLPNPYIGMYHIYPYMLAEDAVFSEEEIRTSLYEDNCRLSLVEINLQNYSETDLSETALSQMDTILSGFDTSSHAVILRLLYDWDGNSSQTEPKNIDIVRRHIISAANVINKHADNIFTLQGVLIGDYGEMHGSRLLTEDNIDYLTNLLYSYVDKDIYLAVRTPAQWRRITKAQQPSMDHGLSSRLGLFNDGIMGNETDVGTYVQRSRKSELEFQEVLCLHVPNGGEVIIDNEYNDYEDAKNTLEQMHISYLNIEYDEAVLNKWKAATETTVATWRGHTGYEYIVNHLGYRYYLSFSEMMDTGSVFSPDLSLRITLKNLGYAPSYRPFSAYIQLVPTGKKAKKDFTIMVPTDMDTLISSETRSVDVPIDEGSLENTDYEVYFYINDDTTGEKILTANEGENLGMLKIGTISCRSLLKK